ncbi:hypothetical protein GALMADRAFT_250616 [Galerina marginata CBS 339.88]|uniref:Tetrapyrrole biosynthesis uroporphyrinogen III synthase domain-containing protein n=1 Tax=Galerina marginata (strain CBS 339.88) TaxID=685588 RepID=A0A067SV75_GALM3|nr:hypothetical protein GALMADRAFT_250616 [Galerina marginata CBS 339.88]
MSKVLLLREPSLDAPDRYELAFKVAGYHPTSISILETVHHDIPGLSEIVKSGPEAQGFTGVIVTSRRSCDAWREALQHLQESAFSTQLGDEGGPESKQGIAGWCAVPFYVVGQTTAAALRDIFSEFKHLGLQFPDIKGQDSGSAASLAPFILEDVRKAQRPVKMLYLVGDKNRDTISRLLSEGGVELESVQVYKTQGSAAFAGSLAGVLASSQIQDRNPWWIVYFAPSAAALVTSILREHFDLEGPTSSLASSTPKLLQSKVAAIGPTTNAFLQDELGLHVHAMAQKPTPEDVVSVITTYDSE